MLSGIKIKVYRGRIFVATVTTNLGRTEGERLPSRLAEVEVGR
jgi:hypothetical protein